MTFPWPEPGTPLEAVQTPMPVIDEDRLAGNIARAQAYLDTHGLAFRPHIKTHKIPAVARAQLDAGARPDHKLHRRSPSRTVVVEQVF